MNHKDLAELLLIGHRQAAQALADIGQAQKEAERGNVLSAMGGLVLARSTLAEASRIVDAACALHMNNMVKP